MCSTVHYEITFWFEVRVNFLKGRQKDVIAQREVVNNYQIVAVVFFDIYVVGFLLEELRNLIIWDFKGVCFYNSPIVLLLAWKRIATVLL